MTRCQCGTAYTDTIDGRHHHRLLSGHSPSPASALRLTGTRWEGVAATIPAKGRRRPR